MQLTHKQLFAFSANVVTFMGVLAPACRGELLGPSEYLSFSDSPFNGLRFRYFYLEDFEDLLLNTPGAAVDHGTIINPTNSFAIDSVDADDGAIDGSGSNGASLFHPTSMTFTFDPIELGSLPTHAGIVWTDGTPNGLVTFEAYDQNGQSLGTVSGNLGDSSFFGTTAEDRFFGAIHPSGISRIFITDNGSANHLEVDHLQYGQFVPEPSNVVLLSVGLLTLLYWRITRQRIF